MPTIGMVARRARCNVETVRYYERIGLLPPPPRGRNGRRDYGDHEVERLRFIRRCRELGFSLKDVHALSALSERSNENCAEIKRLAEEHSKLVREKIADLVRVEAWLTEMIARCGSVRRRDCPLIEGLFQNAPYARASTSPQWR